MRALWVCALCCVTAPLLSMESSSTAALYGEIDRRAEALHDKIITWRRDIHEHPELGNNEFKTSEKIATHLKSLGLEVKTGVAHTGVVALLRGGKPGPVVALRADMDALPVEEKTGLPYASKAKGEYHGKEVSIMHACGHDTHVAMLMAVAELLADMREELPGSVKFIFQPAEEGTPDNSTGGAELMVAEGVMENPTPAAVFGLHVFQGWSSGEVAYRPAATMAASDELYVKVKGKQTHGAQPWSGIDPIVVASEIVMGLQTIVSRQTDLLAAPAIVTVGTINGGVRVNIIPEDVVLTGTVRSFLPAMREELHSRIKRTAEGIATSAGATAEVSITKGYPVTYNDPTLTTQMRGTFERVFGADNVKEAPLVAGAEDFSYYAQKVPGLFFFLGVRPKDVPAEEAIPNHSPLFYADESALVGGVKIMAHLTIDYLQEAKNKSL